MTGRPELGPLSAQLLELESETFEIHDHTDASEDLLASSTSTSSCSSCSGSSCSSTTT